MTATQAKRAKRAKPPAAAKKKPARVVVDPESDSDAGDGGGQSPRSGVTSPVKPRPSQKNLRRSRPSAKSQGGADQPFQEGDIVWANYDGLPMWPVRVGKIGATLGGSRRTGSRSRPRAAIEVVFFGDGATGKLVSFDGCEVYHCDEYADFVAAGKADASYNARDFAKAVREADEAVSPQTAGSAGPNSPASPAPRDLYSDGPLSRFLTQKKRAHAS